MEDQFEKETTSREIGYCKPPISPGRTKGIPNKATTAAREAIANFVDENAQKLQGWLELIANGGKYIGEDGKEVFVIPNPEKAFDLFIKLLEFHLPKIQRTEVTGVEGAPPISIIRDNIPRTAKDEPPAK